LAKILNIIPYKILPAHLGGQKGIATFCKYLGEQNEVTAVSVEDNDVQLADTYEMIPLFSKKRTRYLNPFYVWRIKKLIKQKGIKNVITEHPYMAWMGWFLKKSLGIEWFVHSHNLEFERFRTLGKSWHSYLKVYESWAYRNADHVFFITNEDLHFAVDKLAVNKKKATHVPFGTELKEMPLDKDAQKKKVYAMHNIPPEATLILFNGALDYQPNTNALSFILNEINPLLLEDKSFNYRILICGKNLPSSFNELKNFVDKNVIYAGFVDDVYAYFKAAHIFLNPVVTGGGIKTKAVEAIGCGTTVVSCISGATGIEISVCGEKLKLVPDSDAQSFITAISQIKDSHAVTPASYYKFYYWGNIVKKIQVLFTN
jgi:hypothetical protein